MDASRVMMGRWGLLFLVCCLMYLVVVVGLALRALRWHRQLVRHYERFLPPSLVAREATPLLGTGDLLLVRRHDLVSAVMGVLGTTAFSHVALVLCHPTAAVRDAYGIVSDFSGGQTGGIVVVEVQPPSQEVWKPSPFQPTSPSPCLLAFGSRRLGAVGGLAPDLPGR
jgi:hypothetical protein